MTYEAITNYDFAGLICLAMHPTPTVLRFFAENLISHLKMHQEDLNYVKTEWTSRN